MPRLRTIEDLAREALQHVPEIDARELERRMIAERLLLIDVREPAEWQRIHIPGAAHLPRGVLERDIEKTCFNGAATEEDLDRPIICYCNGGTRSILAAHTLRRMGFRNVASLRGGLRAWQERRRPDARTGPF